ncbi:MAG: hypothetical protein U9O96_02800 [Candidatus Thermoplasmatota archaeon]|nr:hypothetical protein [Candidatus Thermoplasmatota archaeon]
MSFIKDKRGISEEFTSLPALIIVMIGFALFFALIAGVYYSYNERIERADKYEVANFVLEKVTSTSSPLKEGGVIRTGGLIDAHVMGSNRDNLGRVLREKCNFPGWEYKVEVEWDKGSENLDVFTYSGENMVAASKKVAVYLNEAQTVPGEFTVIVWRI